MKRTALIALIAVIALGFVTQVLPVLAAELGGGGARRVRNGDVNGDGVRDISDVIYHLSNLFSGGPEPLQLEDEAPPTSLLAEVQASAERILGKFPKQEEISQLPPRARKYMSYYHGLVASAAASAPSWTAAELDRHAGSLHAVLVAWPIYQSLICQIFPERCIDWDCMDRCGDQLEWCLNGCQGKPGLEYTECFLACNTAFAECSLDCVR